MSTVSPLAYPPGRPFVDPESYFCPHCDGTGKVAPVAPDTEIGSAVSAIRRRHDVDARYVAKEMGFSPQYLSDLEHGRRGWSLDLIRRYKDAVRKVLES